MATPMLNDQDRRALRDIERALTRQDPVLAARMRAPIGARRFPTVSFLCVVLYLSLPLVTLLFGWPVAVATLGIVAVAIATKVIHRRRRGR
jgi:DUF3040 family protein